MFTPLAYPNGIIIYDLTISLPPHPHLELFPFEIYREPLVVLGIADGTELHGKRESLPRDLESSPKRKDGEPSHPSPDGLDVLLGDLASLRENHPRALVHQLLIFDYDNVKELLNGPGDIIWIPTPAFSRATTIKTVLCDVTSLLLSELDEFAKLLQSIPAIDSPRALSWGPRRGPELRPRPIDKLLRRITIPSQLPPGSGGTSDTRPLPGRSSPSSTGHDSPTTFDEINRSIKVANSASTGKPGSKESSRDRSSIHALSAADRTKSRIKGRLGVVIGTLYLQSGRWPDALRELVEAASLARASSDYVWYGKALESILLSLIMLAWAGSDFQIPQICFPGIEKSNSKSSHRSTNDGAPGNPGSASRTQSLQILANLLPDISNNILNLYGRAAIITDEPLPQVVYSETVIRLSKLLAAIHTRDGHLDDIALNHVVMNNPLLRKDQSKRPVGSIHLRKHELAAFIFRALPLAPSSELPVTDAVPLFVGIASVLSMLDLQRKRAVVLRELLSIMIPGLIEARKIGAAEMGIHPAAGLSSLTTTTFDVNALDSAGNVETSIRALLSMVADTYGVEPVQGTTWQRCNSDNRSCSESAPSHDTLSGIAERALVHSALEEYGDLDLKIDVLKAAINLCEALPDFEGVLHYTVALLQTIRGDLMLPKAGRCPPLLPQDEQARLLNNIKRTMSAAHNLGETGLEAEFWDDFLIRGVECLEHPDIKRPFPHSKKDLSAARSTSNKSKNDPFLYSPFSKAHAESSEYLLIAEESASFKVTLQNPYEFELEIETLRLHDERQLLTAEISSFSIAPLSLQEVLVTGTVKHEGLLNITGCVVKIRNCRPRKFLIFSQVWKPEPQIKVKKRGLAAKEDLSKRPLSWSLNTSKDSKPSPKIGPLPTTCSIKVIRKQPSIIIHSTSLSQSALMILEGETKCFDITLQNASSCPVDFILFTFQDSTTRQLQSALSNKDLLASEVYDLELQLSTKPSLRWKRQAGNDGDLYIAPNERATFTIEVLGKPGLQDAMIQIDYSFLGIPQDEITQIFYTRQIHMPITVTVNASIEVVRCDIAPLSGDFAWHNTPPQMAGVPGNIGDTAVQPFSKIGTMQFSSALPRLRITAHAEDHCLLMLDLRNAWPNSLFVCLHVSDASRVHVAHSPVNTDNSTTIIEELQPGQVSRFALVIPRVYLYNCHAPVPALNTGSRRQFVVSANKLTLEGEIALREAFWYREELFKRVSSTWKEAITEREGLIDLRTIRLNPRMVDAMRLEDIEITYELKQAENKSDLMADNVVQTGKSKYRIRTNEFLTLTVVICNRSLDPIHPLLRLQPALRNQPGSLALELSRRLSWTGMLQRVLPVLNPGGTSHATLGITALCRGEFEIGASLEEVRILKKPLEEAPTSSKSSSDGSSSKKNSVHFNGPDGDQFPDTFLRDSNRIRRVWHAQEFCVISAQEGSK